MLGIITGTICPDKEVGQLVLKDTIERLKQYEESIEFFINSKAFNKLIFCDNSNYDIKRLEYLEKHAEVNGIELELLSFKGDAQGVKFHGKGYGEGEIMKYIVNHSKLLKNENFFVKITGRLKIDNIKEITEKLDPSKIYFNIPNRNRRDMYDTRMYGMPLSYFKKYFADAYHKVNDPKGIFLEYVYTDVVLENSFEVTNFPRYPRIVGISGSSGTVYGYTEWKCKIKDLLSGFNYYCVKVDIKK